MAVAGVRHRSLSSIATDGSSVLDDDQPGPNPSLEDGGGSRGHNRSQRLESGSTAGGLTAHGASEPGVDRSGEGWAAGWAGLGRMGDRSRQPWPCRCRRDVGVAVGVRPGGSGVVVVGDAVGGGAGGVGAGVYRCRGGRRGDRHRGGCGGGFGRRGEGGHRAGPVAGCRRGCPGGGGRVRARHVHGLAEPVNRTSSATPTPPPAATPPRGPVGSGTAPAGPATTGRAAGGPRSPGTAPTGPVPAGPDPNPRSIARPEAVLHCVELSGWSATGDCLR